MLCHVVCVPRRISNQSTCTLGNAGELVYILVCICRFPPHQVHGQIVFICIKLLNFTKKTTSRLQIPNVIGVCFAGMDQPTGANCHHCHSKEQLTSEALERGRVLLTHNNQKYRRRFAVQTHSISKPISAFLKGLPYVFDMTEYATNLPGPLYNNTALLSYLVWNVVWFCRQLIKFTLW